MSSKTTPAPPAPSALTDLLTSPSSATLTPAETPTTPPVSSATLQILHNLQHQHLWTSLQVHRLALPPPPPSTSSNSTQTTQSSQQKQEQGYLISGLPPARTYTHPDEQLYMLSQGLREEDIDPERTFVLPTVQGQSWSLRRMAAVFDALPAGGQEGASLMSVEDDGDGEGEGKRDDGKQGKIAEYLDHRSKARASGEWGGKRLLLSMVDRGMGGDGTVVYYVVQEGAVKPRQN